VCTAEQRCRPDLRPLSVLRRSTVVWLLWRVGQSADEWSTKMHVLCEVGAMQCAAMPEEACDVQAWPTASPATSALGNVSTAPAQHRGPRQDANSRVPLLVLFKPIVGRGVDPGIQNPLFMRLSL